MLGNGTREGTCSLFDAGGNVCGESEVKVFANVSAGADTKANTRALVRGHGVLELGDLCLLEDGRERGDVLRSDVVALETVRKGQGGAGR